MDDVDHFESLGYEVLPHFITPEQTRSLLASLCGITVEARSGGVRNIDAKVPAIAAFAADHRLLSLAQRHIGGRPRLIRAIYFEKSPQNNWLVSWHQDRTVAVAERFDAPGWGPWSLKDGVWHGQPPLTFLQNMVTVRVHLDDSTIENGCLKLIPGSHRSGLLTQQAVAQHVAACEFIFCPVPAGGALAMRSHLLHASEKASRPSHRRVLHFEYSGTELPAGGKE
ncbi:phytanoyl-CoA dioxygenase family protein [soil metagenome]